MKTRIAALVLLGFCSAVAADPGPTSKWLMNEPVSMLTFGNYLMGEALDAAIKDVLVGKVGANVTYEWDADRIQVYTWMHVQAAEFITKKNCRDLIAAAKNRLGIDPATGKPPEYPNYKPTSSYAVTFYTQDGYSSGETKELAAQIDKIILIHGLVQNVEDFSVAPQKCQSPLLGTEMMYSE